MSTPKVLIPVALGTNRDGDLADAFRLAGADPVSLPLEALRAGEASMDDFQMLAVPGGFSYGDALGAGRLLGLDLVGWFGDQLHAAVAAGKPIFGVCNGFQALVRTGLLPGGDHQSVLAHNDSGHFECRWVTLAPSSASVWTKDLTEPLRCPVAHAEGKFVAEDLAALEAADLVAFRYLTVDGEAAGGAYPANPNGSPGDVAGVTDSTGLVLGLMPHPEDHVTERQDPLRGRTAPTGSGLCLPLFEAGVAAVTA